nr:hypothetical protein BaRGS_011778 [Batillaria attramentaria]
MTLEREQVQTACDSRRMIVHIHPAGYDPILWLFLRPPTTGNCPVNFGDDNPANENDDDDSDDDDDDNDDNGCGGGDDEEEEEKDEDDDDDNDDDDDDDSDDDDDDDDDDDVNLIFQLKSDL